MEEYIGLNSAEVEANRKKYGSNLISEINKSTVWDKFWENFNNPIITILLISLGINIFFTFLGMVDWYECAGIFASVLIATIVSTLSEYKNESTFQKLREEAAETFCKVYRNKKLCEISINDIVKNDIVLIQAGDIIPADGTIISGRIKVDQSALNGESKEIEKIFCNSDASERSFWDKSSLFRGSVVCDGQAIMKVWSVGENTMYGALSAETQIDEEKSPLNIKLSKLAKDISKFGYIGAILIFVLFIIQKSVVENNFSYPDICQYFMNFPVVMSDIIEAVIMCVTILVVAVPDGLPLMIAIVCSLNMRKMLKDKVLVRKIMGLETAGGLNILFTDKTGTLTKGKLSVTNFYDGNNGVYNRLSDMPEKMKKLMSISIIYNSGAYISGDKIIGGNATEKALCEHVKNQNFQSINLNKFDEIPFSSKNKYSECSVNGEMNLRLIKGAPEIILGRCKKYLDHDGNVRNFSGSVLLNKINSLADNTQRIICFAYKEYNISDEYIFLTAVAIKDELRYNAGISVQEVKRAGIKVVMITGDKKETAVSVAKECNIISSSKDIVLVSDKLNKMSDEEVKRILPDLCVVSRAVPSDKSRLVRLAKECGMVTGMTGDGVNDAPALKTADVGFAMGSGTDIAKEAGDIVIVDDDFKSIKKAVLYGRTIYKSIKKFITFQLTINIAAVSISVFSFFFGIIKPLTITQMLWLNLLMDTLAAIAFGGEAALGKYMLEKPISKNSAILDRKMWNSIIINSGFITLMSAFFFFSDTIQHIFTKNDFYTGYFNFFVFTSVFNAFNTRVDGIDLFENISANKRFVSVMGLISFVQVLITYLGGDILRTSCINIREWIVILTMSILIIPMDFLRKLITK